MSKSNMGETTPEAIERDKKRFVEEIKFAYEDEYNLRDDLEKEKKCLVRRIESFDNISDKQTEKRYEHLQTMISIQKFKVMVLNDLLENHGQVSKYLKWEE